MSMDIATEFVNVVSLPPVEARERLEKAGPDEITLLDVRQPHEYAAGHLPGARLIPLPELLDRLGEIPENRPLIVYCRSGNRSRSATVLLMAVGHKTVYNMAGGILAWNGQKATGDYGSGLFLLEGLTQPAEYYALAWALEDGASRFYKSIAEMVNDREAADIFLDLGANEVQHKAGLATACRNLCGISPAELSPPANTPVNIMEGGILIDQLLGYIAKQGSDLLGILEIAMQIEANSLDLYLKMLNQIKDESAVAGLNALVKDEKEHLRKLGRLIELQQE